MAPFVRNEGAADGSEVLPDRNEEDGTFFGLVKSTAHFL